jgi:formate hydrogenlyase subunit 4
MNLELDRLIIELVQGITLLLIAPGVVGLLNYLRARLQNRQRSTLNLWQPYRVLWSRIRQPVVRAQQTGWVFRFAPAGVFGIYVALAFFIPLFYETSLIRSDLITVIYMLALGRFLLALGGLDSSSPLAVLGSSREMFYYFLTEISFGAFLMGMALHWQTVRLDQIYVGMQNYSSIMNIDLVMLGFSLCLTVLCESGRLPMDNPETNLELTMAQKAVSGEYSGRDLALLDWGEMIKFTFLITLFIDFFFPLPFDPTNLFIEFGIEANLPGLIIALLALLFYLCKLIFCCMVIAVWESIFPKLMLRKLPEFTLVSLMLCFAAVVYIVFVL